jgi:hypothetical protein
MACLWFVKARLDLVFCGHHVVTIRNDTQTTSCALLKKSFVFKGKSGGARRNRTDDLLHAMQALSQLSYDPTGLSKPGGT